MIVLHRHEDGRLIPEYRHPDEIASCRSVGALHQLLARYESATFEGPTERRRYVEQVRPALRWHCWRYELDPPKWLATDEAIKALSDEERIALFGSEPLTIIEFRHLRTNR